MTERLSVEESFRQQRSATTCNEVEVYESELKFSPRTESRDRENESEFTCDSGFTALIPDAGSLPLFSDDNKAIKCVCTPPTMGMDGKRAE